jgi:chromosome segregation ATPase
MMHLKDEEEKVSRLLHSELEALKVQYSDLQRSLIDDETEKENLRQQIFHLRSELKKKDDALTTIASIPQNSKEMTNLSEKIKMLEVNLQIPVIEQIGPLRKMLDNQILIPLSLSLSIYIYFIPLHFS